MAKIEKIGNIQIVDNKEDKFFYFPMISMACTGLRDVSGQTRLTTNLSPVTGNPPNCCIRHYGMTSGRKRNLRETVCLACVPICIPKVL